MHGICNAYATDVLLLFHVFISLNTSLTTSVHDDGVRCNKTLHSGLLLIGVQTCVVIRLSTVESCIYQKSAHDRSSVWATMCIDAHSHYINRCLAYRPGVQINTQSVLVATLKLSHHLLLIECRVVNPSP